MVASELIGYRTHSFVSNETDPLCVFGPPYAIAVDTRAPTAYASGTASSSIATGDAIAYQSAGHARQKDLSFQLSVSALDGEKTTNARVSTSSSFAVNSMADMKRVQEDLVVVGYLEELSKSYQMGDEYHTAQDLSSEGAVIEHVTVYGASISENPALPVANQLTYTAGAIVGAGPFHELRMLDLDEGIDTTRLVAYDRGETSGGIIIMELIRAERDEMPGGGDGTGSGCIFNDLSFIETVTETQGHAEAYTSSRIIGVDNLLSEVMTRVVFGSAEKGIDFHFESHIEAPADLRSEFELSMRDLDEDGLYEDLNNNGRLDYADISILFENMAWLVEDERGLLFDFNHNGKLDYADIVVLFEMIQNQ
jgi:PKD repeat protein